MLGLMMDTPLLISSLMNHAEKNFPEQEIISVASDDPNHRYTFKDAFKRTRQLANGLQKLGIQHGDRLGTLRGMTTDILSSIMRYPAPVSYATPSIQDCFPNSWFISSIMLRIVLSFAIPCLFHYWKTYKIN